MKAIPYTHGHALAVVQSHALRTAEEYASHVISKLKLGDSILDVGCGPGSITRGFRKYVGRDGRVVGLDTEEGLLEEARKAAGNDVEFIRGDGYRVPFPNESFDVVHAHQVLQHVGDPVAMLREMKRLARRGGIVAVREVDFETWSWYPENERLKKWTGIYTEICRRNGANPHAGRRLAAWFSEAGFGRNHVSFSGHTVVYSRERAVVWGEAWAKRITETKLADQAIQYGLATRQDLDEYASEWRTWSMHPDAFHFYVDIAAVGSVPTWATSL